MRAGEVAVEAAVAGGSGVSSYPHECLQCVSVLVKTPGAPICRTWV